MNKFIKTVAGVLSGCLMISSVALAGSQALIIETYTGNSDISVYIKGTEVSEGGVNVQIATTEADGIEIQSVSELEIPMQTMVLVDNSISISSKNREKIAEFLQNLISDRMGNEEICIATFSEDISVLADYTSDYGTLKKAVEGIAYQDQETYLTDVLYDLIALEYSQGTEDVYRRIIIVSDGVDNKSLGYTKDELYSLLKDTQIPIYTIGCVNGKNNDELESMFALSRTTLVDYFLLDEIEDTLDITSILNQDRTIMKLTITPSVEVMDGSKKAVKIILPSDTILTAEVMMPQNLYVKQPEETPSEQESAVQPEPEVVIEKTESKSNYLVPVLAGIVMAAIIVAVVFVLLIVKKKKSGKAEFETIDENVLNELNKKPGSIDEKTEMIKGPDLGGKEDGDTVIILGNDDTCYVVLTDIKSPAKSFQAPLNNSIIVGRKKELCDIALDYEKSVSGKHCEISVKAGRFYVKDLQSANGTYLNDSRILTETEIFSGNKLKLGRLEMRFEVR